MARQLEVSRFTGLKLLQSGDIPTVNIALPGDSRSRLRVYESDFYDWLASRETPTDRRRKVPV